MFDFYGCYFEYDGFNSMDYDLIFANVDTSRIISLESEREVNVVKSRKNYTDYMTQVPYNDSIIQFDAEILKSDGTVIAETDVPLIEKILFSRSKFGRLKQFEFNEKRPVYINCIFVNPERIEVVGGVVGFKFTVITDSIMAWEEEHTQVVTDLSINTFIVKVVSDMPDYIYPIVTITTGSEGGNLTIYNNTDSATRFTSFSNLPAATTFTMNGELKHIPKEMYEYFSDRNFIRLLDGDNSFFVNGDVARISFTFSNRRYI